MKTAKTFTFLTTTLVCGALGLAPQAKAQTGVTVPPASAPVASADPLDAQPALKPPEPVAPQIATTAGAQAPSAPLAPSAPSAPAFVAPEPAAAAAPTGMAVTAAPVGVPAAATPMALPANPSVAAVPNGLGAVPTGAPLPANAPTGTPAVVSQVMQNLQQSGSNVSVEDLSRAQDALTRLDLLLQIEKKMGEIKQVQDDHNGAAGGANGAFGPVAGMGGGMISQVPAGALVLPANGGTVGAGAAMAPPPKPVSTDYEVEQVSGANGDYTATLRNDDGDIKMVKVGDRLNGRTVESISLDGVHLAGSGKRGSKQGGKTLELKTNGMMTTPVASLLR